MRKKYRLIRRIKMRVRNLSLLLLALILLVSCGKKDENIIKIGVIAPLTGEGATYGAAMKRGFDLAFKDSKNITLIYEDDRLSPKEGINAINKLINNDKVQVILGSAASGVTLAMAPIAEKNKVILFSTISSSDNLKESGDYIFRNVPRNEIQGKTAAEFIYTKLGKKTAIVLNKNDEYGVNLSRSFKSRFTELGGTILLEDKYQPQSNDFKTAITKIKNYKADAVYIPGNYQETAQLLKQSKEANLNVVFVGGDGSYSPELIKIAGNSAEGSYFTLMAVNKETDYYKNFYKKFSAKYGKEPDIYDAYAYEGGCFIKEAIDKVGYNSEKIKQFLYTTNFISMTGELKFDKDGEVQRDYGIVKVTNGNFAEVK
jgi:branched-chain amino acid transport system substrate-binding protein